MFMTISCVLSGCMQNVAGCLELTKVVFPMSVKATL